MFLRFTTNGTNWSGGRSPEIAYNYETQTLSYDGAPNVSIADFVRQERTGKDGLLTVTVLTQPGIPRPITCAMEPTCLTNWLLVIGAGLHSPVATKAIPELAAA